MSRPVPILYLIDLLYAFSGTERHLYDLVTHLDRNRFRPFVVAFRGSAEFARSVESNGVPVRILDMEKIYGLRPLRMLFSLRRFVKREKIGILQTFHTNPDLYGTVLARLSGIPAIVSSRRDMGLGRNPRTLLGYRLLNRCVDRVICVSEEVRRFVREREGLGEEKLRVIYNGIESGRFSAPPDPGEEKRKLGIPPRAPVAGMLANFNPVKGHRYFLEAAARVRAQVPEAWFVLAGDGPLHEEMRLLARRLGLGGRAVFLGHRQDSAPALAVMDVLVSASLSEGLSNTLLEALFMKKAVVATRAGGNPEIVFPGETGLLVPPADPAAIARAVVRLLRDRPLAARLGANGGALVEKRFLLGDMMERTMSLYEELICEKGITGASSGAPALWCANDPLQEATDEPHRSHHCP